AAMAAVPRWRERLFGLYFLSHIPVTLLVDLPLLLPDGLRPRELLEWYTATFRDPLMLQPPAWFKAFMYCEAVLQLPFFPVAVYAFLKGWCQPSVSTCPARHLFVTLAFCRAEEVYLSVLDT
uniref:Transmembrane protein 97 n=1 Tax=Otus sunia TaxID=257818 RepID=A0A8C8BGF9_9STRI